MCIKNKTNSVIEQNTTAPPQTHSAAKKERENHITVSIPFITSPEYKDTISVGSGSRIVVEEKSENGWIYVKNMTNVSQGWIPEYCVKKYDAWFEELTALAGKHVEKCAAIRDFDPSGDISLSSMVFQFLNLREGDVFTVCERSKSGWNLVINSDGSKQGWVPDNRCKVIREGSDNHQAAAIVHNTEVISRGTYVVRRSFVGDEKQGELSLNQGDTVSVRQAVDSGWTLGVVVIGGARKEGWFPDWIIDRGVLDDKANTCVYCRMTKITDSSPPVSYVRISTVPHDIYGPICSNSCWDQWMVKRKLKR